MSTKLFDRVNGEVQTTNATATAIYNYTIPDNSAANFRILVDARDTSGNTKTFSLETAATTGVGSGHLLANLLGSLLGAVLRGDSGTGGWTVTTAQSGNIMTVSVTGAAATTINWAVYLEAWVYTP